jgi:hypothetical protein
MESTHSYTSPFPLPKMKRKIYNGAVQNTQPNMGASQSQQVDTPLAIRAECCGSQETEGGRKKMNGECRDELMLLETKAMSATEI